MNLHSTSKKKQDRHHHGAQHAMQESAIELALRLSLPYKFKES
jgi:hypothetical protein